MIRPGHNFLEIGAGNLKLSQELLRLFNHGTLVDYNVETQFLYDRLDVSLHERFELIISDFSSLVLPQQYDCVIACEVLEHVQDDEAFVQKAYCLLRDQGQLILSVPSRMKFWSRHDEIVGHLRRYEKNDIIQLLKKNKFRNINIVSYGYPFVNLLRWASICLATYHYHEKKQWSQKKQSQKSGIVRTDGMADLLGILVNQYSTYPLCAFASLFNKFDLSNGYIITAGK
ncbi:MAG: class I SAM-dependent methyltransferase [Deltaproteobacteria bacterium]|nr:class I SAM-dependent methyltransferase [Deltaproteobacteria bacterium]